MELSRNIRQANWKMENRYRVSLYPFLYQLIKNEEKIYNELQSQ